LAIVFDPGTARIIARGIPEHDQAAYQGIAFRLPGRVVAEDRAEMAKVNGPGGYLR